MGFNIEQYEMDNNYSNILGIGSGKLKAKLGIGDGKILGVVVNPTKNAQFEANKYITSGQAAIDEQKAIDDKKALDVVEEAKAKAEAKRIADEEAKKIADEKARQDAIIAQDKAKKSDINAKSTDEKSKTMLYVGIGAGVLILATIVTVLIVKRNK